MSDLVFLLRWKLRSRWHHFRVWRWSDQLVWHAEATVDGLRWEGCVGPTRMRALRALAQQLREQDAKARLGDE